MQGSAAIAAGVGAETAVAVASTGVIGVPLPIDSVTSGIAARRARSCAPTATPTSPTRSGRPTRSPSAPASSVAAERRAPSG